MIVKQHIDTKEYITKLHTELLKVKQNSIEIERIIDILIDIVNYFVGSTDYKTIQVKIGVCNLFKGFIVKDWYGESKTN